MNKFYRTIAAEHTITGICSVCGLKLWQRDVEYSVWKKGRALCKEHFNPPPNLLDRITPMTPPDEQESFISSHPIEDIPF